MSDTQEKVVGVRLYMIMLGMLLAGTANTILTKWQNNLEGEPGKVDFGDCLKPEIRVLEKCN